MLTSLWLKGKDTYIFKFKLLGLNSFSKENIQTILVSEFMVLKNIWIMRFMNIYVLGAP